MVRSRFPLDEARYPRIFDAVMRTMVRVWKFGGCVEVFRWVLSTSLGTQVDADVAVAGYT